MGAAYAAPVIYLSQASIGNPMIDRKCLFYTLGLTVFFLLLVALLTQPRCVSYEPFHIPFGADVCPYGINVELSQYTGVELGRVLDFVQQAGFCWVRQRFPWAEIEPEPGQFRWEKWDAIVKAVSLRGLGLVAVLDTSPKWARAPKDAANPYSPPHEVSDFGHFAQAFAHRYGADIDYYQIWDEPNIYPHWGEGYVSPTGYTALLREGYIQIKAADPEAYILTAGLAPTTESGPLNLNEVDFLREMLAAGAGGFFDILAAKAYGFDSPPAEPPALSRLNFRRVELLKEVVQPRPLSLPRLLHLAGSSPQFTDYAIWLVEAGWNALPPDWEGESSIWGSVSEEEQARYTVEALRWAQEHWPWAGAVFIYHFQPAVPPDDPRWGFSLLWQDDSPRPVYRAVEELAASPPLLYPGPHRANHPAISYKGDWRLSPLGADIPHGAQGDASMEVPFVGTGLDIVVRRGDYWALMYVTVDGKPANALPRDSQGRSYLILHDPLHKVATITLAKGLPYGHHIARLTPYGGWSQWAILGFRVRGQEHPLWPRVLALTGGYILALILPWAYSFSRKLERSTRVAVARGLCLFTRVIESAKRLDFLSFFVAVMVYFAPPIPSLPLLLLLFVLIFIRPQAGLAITAFCIPLFMRTKVLLGREFPVLELSLFLTAGAMFLREFPYVKNLVKARGKLGETLPKLAALDWTVISLVTLAALSLFWAENFGVAIHEFRTVIVESALFYGLIRWSTEKKGSSAAWLLVDALVLGAVLVSLVGLFQFIRGEVITAEGVRRVRAFYGSPNNLGLFLGRIVPIVMAIGIWGRGLRRSTYALAGVPIVAALYLTFSRGAWFLGLPAALAFMGLMRGRRATLVTLAFLLALSLAFLPWMGTERFATTFELAKGTGFFRIKLWQASVNMLRDHPILGVGLDNFLYQYRTRYVLPEAWQELDLSHPHNILLDWWTRLGIGGVALLGWMLWAFFATGIRNYRQMPGGMEKTLLLGLMASMVDCLAHGLIDNSFFLVDLAFTFMLSLALCVREGAD